MVPDECTTFRVLLIGNAVLGNVDRPGCEAVNQTQGTRETIGIYFPSHVGQLIRRGLPGPVAHGVLAERVEVDEEARVIVEPDEVKRPSATCGEARADKPREGCLEPGTAVLKSSAVTGCP